MSIDFNDKKFIISLIVGFLAIFSGSFLAFYFVFNQFTKSYNVISVRSFKPSEIISSQEKFIEDFNKSFEEIEKNNQFFSNMSQFSSFNVLNNDFSVINLDENKNSYILKLNLKPFGNNEKNVNIDIKDKKIIIKANYEDKSSNSYNSSNFYQSLSVSEPINKNQIKKVVKDENLILTIPKKNTQNL